MLECFNRDMPGTGALLLLAFATLVVIVLLGYVIHATIPDRPRQRMFIASVAFVITFMGVRAIVMMIRAAVGPFNWVTVGGRHIHHLVWGILILLLVGYGWMLDLGRSHTPLSIFFSRLMSVSYGVGAALTLDEFALWLNLEPDAYWTHEGRISIDAVILFGALLGVGAWGAPFFRSIQRLWTRHSELRGRIAAPIRRARLLRPRRVRRLPPRIVP